MTDGTPDASLPDAGPVAPDALEGQPGRRGSPGDPCAVPATDNLHGAILPSVNHAGTTPAPPASIPPEWLRPLETQDVIVAVAPDTSPSSTPEPRPAPLTQRYPAW